MHKTTRLFVGDSFSSAKRMTPHHRAGASLGRFALLVSLIAGCSSVTADGGDEVRPVASTAGDASHTDRAPEAPSESLCTLAGPPPVTPGDVLVHGDDFSGSAVDPLKWNIASGYRGHGTILNTTSPDNAVVSQGFLSFVTRRNPADGIARGGPNYPYVSAYVDSLGKFARTYGKIEFRARFPYVPGVWYALWGRPWSQSFPEIDIEVLNVDSVGHSRLYFVNHWAAPPLPAPERRTFRMMEDIDVSQFHVYTVNWRPGFLEWSVDGVAKMQADPRGIPDLPVFWILNGWVGGWAGDPTDRTPFPSTFEVDYVRVYRVDGLVGEPALRLVKPLARYTRTNTLEIAAANFDESCAHVAMYDGDALVRTTSTAPFRFPLSMLAPGQHKLSFVATDGVRRTSMTLDIQIH